MVLSQVRRMDSWVEVDLTAPCSRLKFYVLYYGIMRSASLRAAGKGPVEKNRSPIPCNRFHMPRSGVRQLLMRTACAFGGVPRVLAFRREVE